MARKKKKEEHVNHERWLVSYADFITLLFAFFTSLYAISTVDAQKAGKMVFSTRAAFNVDFFPSEKPVLGLSNPIENMDISSMKMPKERFMQDSTSRPKKLIMSTPEGRTRVKTVQQIFSELREIIELRRVDGSIALTMNRNNIVVSLRDTAFFEPGSATIEPWSLPLLDTVAERLLQSHMMIRVEGHSDDQPPPKTSKFHSNWELSAARAVTVVQYLAQEFGYPPENLSVAGYASSRPSSTNDSAAGRTGNRRVDIVLLNDQSQ